MNSAGPDHVGDLGARSPRVHDGSSDVDCGGCGSEQVERALGARDVLDTDVGVDLGRAQRGVAEQRLDDRFRLLTGGRRTAVPRQQTASSTACNEVIISAS